MTTIEPRTATSPAVPRVASWHPGWLGLVLGTAGTAVAGLLDPVRGTVLDEAVGAVMAGVAAVLMPLLLVPYAVRLMRHRAAMAADLANPGVGALFGTVPAAVLIVGLALAQLGVMTWLPAWVAWIAAVLLVLGVLGALALGVEFLTRVVTRDDLPTAMMTGAWFIPIVVLVLTPSVMTRIGALLPSWDTPTAAAVAIALWGAGFVLFLVLAPVIAWRLVTGPGPIAHQAPSLWIWLAPAGAGGLGVLAVTRMTGRVLGPGAPDVLEIVGLLGATALWGFGAWWALFAGRLLVQVRRAHRGLPFHVGSWGFSFPTAALAALTTELGRSWDAPVLQYVGVVGWVAAVAAWAALAVHTARGIWDGTVFAR